MHLKERKKEIRMIEVEDSGKYMTTKRFETLVDGIFAIAMTLLVLNLAVPRNDGLLSDVAFQNALYGLIPTFISFLVSFILLTIFWKAHHRFFNEIKKLDSTLLWINVIWLLFIVLVPFSASLTGQYRRFTISHIIFHGNMLGIALFLYLNWYYAHRKGFIHDKVEPFEITIAKRVSLAFIIITLLALAIVKIGHHWSQAIYSLILPVEWLAGRRKKG
jgi:uncharacterized membrane protein